VSRSKPAAADAPSILIEKAIIACVGLLMIAVPQAKKTHIIRTVGHSTRPIQEFIAILNAHEIRAIADVRQYPGSRRYPHFNADQLRESLAAHQIQYHHFKSLGGRRSPEPDSPNTAWRNPQFRGYADYMQTPEFRTALDSLMIIADQSSTAIMCAEAVPWRCHRSLIADALIARGWHVLDIMSINSAKPHVLNRHAKIAGSNLIYPAASESLFDSSTEERP
jgi:uncharacterized protein (DUF488 family)